MAILITGAAGFIGAALAERLLARGDTVLGIDNLNDYYDPSLKRARLARLKALGGDFTFAELDFADKALDMGDALIISALIPLNVSKQILSETLDRYAELLSETLYDRQGGVDEPEYQRPSRNHEGGHDQG